MRDAGEPHERRDRADLVVHHRDVGRFDRAVRAAHAHGDADVGAREGRGVVDAVAHHGGEALFLHGFDFAKLVVGEESRTDVFKTEFLGERLRGGGGVPRQKPRREAHGAQLAQTFGGVFLHRVGKPEDRPHAEPVGERHGRHAGFGVAHEGVVHVGRQDAHLVERALVYEPKRAASDAARHAAPRQGREALDRLRFDSLLVGPTHDRLRERVLVHGGETRRHAVGRRVIKVVRIEDVRDRGLALRERTRLVEPDEAQFPGFFKVQAALHEKAAARGRRKARDHRDRGGDHECAGAGDDEEAKRLVEPTAPVAEEKRRNDRDDQGHDEDERRINRREAVDEALHRRLRGLRVFDCVDDARRKTVGRGRRDEHFDRGREVHGSRPDGRVFSLFRGQTFARHHGFVQRRRALQNLAVQRHAVARRHAHDGARQHLGHGFFDVAAVGLAHHGLFGRNAHQIADRIARAVHGELFDRFGNLKERHHHGGFGPGADQHAPHHRDAHERVHVEVAVPKRGETASEGGETGQGDGDQGEDDRRPRRGFDAYGEALGRIVRPKLDRFRKKPDDERRDVAPPGNGISFGSGRLALHLHAGRFIAAGFDRGLDGLGRRFVARNRHRTAFGVAFRAFDPALLERLLDFGHLDGAVHVGHLEDDSSRRRPDAFGLVPAGFDRFLHGLRRRFVARKRHGAGFGIAFGPFDAALFERLLDFGHLDGTVHVGHLEDDSSRRLAKQLGAVAAGLDRRLRGFKGGRHAHDAPFGVKGRLGQSRGREGLFNLRRFDGAVHFRDADRNRRGFALGRLRNTRGHAELFHFAHERFDGDGPVRHAHGARRIVKENLLDALHRAQSLLHGPSFDGTTHFLNGQNGDHQNSPSRFLRNDFSLLRALHTFKKLEGQAARDKNSTRFVTFGGRKIFRLPRPRPSGR